MRQIIKFVFGLALSSSVFSASPVDGVYLGVLGQLSHGPSNAQLNFFVDQPFTGTIIYESIGGGLGVSLGYKVFNFQIEGEFLTNLDRFGKLKVGTCTLISPTVFGPEGICPDFLEENGIGFNGNTLGFYGLINVIYDFFLSQNSDATVFPYIGVGVGGALLQHSAFFGSNEQYLSEGGSPNITSNLSTSNTGFAVQGIIGIGSYLDDFTTMGIDFRYVTTLNFTNSNNTNNNSVNSSAFGIYTVNLTATMVLGDGQ